MGSVASTREYRVDFSVVGQELIAVVTARTPTGRAEVGRTSVPYRPGDDRAYDRRTLPEYVRAAVERVVGEWPTD